MISVPRLLSALSVLSVLLAAPAPAAAQSIAGEWEASMETPGGTMSVSKVTFKVDGQKVTGTVKRAAGDAPLTGTIVGDTLRFAYTIEYNGNAFGMAVVALVTGNTMRGNISFGGQAEAAWTAARVPAPEQRPRQR